MGIPILKHVIKALDFGKTAAPDAAKKRIKDRMSGVSGVVNAVSGGIDKIKERRRQARVKSMGNTKPQGNRYSNSLGGF